MIYKSVSVNTRRSSSAYQIAIGSDLLNGIGRWAADLGNALPEKAVIISNAKVFGIYGREVERSLQRSGISASTFLIGDGERFKNIRSLEKALHFFGRVGLSRTDCVFALGGGVTGDLAGFAASVYLRGIPFVSVPTTLLSMIDSSVGGKTGVNTSFGKNLIGAFHQPKGVLIDVSTLRTLPARELTAGFCEAVKQAAISGGKLLDRTAAFLEGCDIKRFTKQLDENELAIGLSELIAAQVAFKAWIVRGDEFESVSNFGNRSRKILNFGHTFAHALEKVTKYRRLKHGEAVGYGIMFAAELSKKLELLASDEVNLLYDVLHRVGPLPSIRDVDSQEILEAFRYDKKIVNTSLNWVLLKGIGSPVIVPDGSIPRSAIKQTLKKIIQK